MTQIAETESSPFPNLTRFLLGSQALLSDESCSKTSVNLSQLATPIQIGPTSTRTTMVKPKTNTWISPRQSNLNTSAKLRLMNSGGDTDSQTQLSEDIKSVALDLHNQSVI